MSLLCKLGFHDYVTIAECDGIGKSKYKECDRCDKRIVINDYLYRDGRKRDDITYNIYVDDEWLSGKTKYPITKREHMMTHKPSKSNKK